MNLVERTNGRLAQLGEHLPYKQGVIGSSPIVPTKLLFAPIFFTREWLSGRALPCQGKCREFESRFPLHTKRDRSCAYLFLCDGKRVVANSLVRVTEQSLIAREYAEGLPHKSNEVDFVQGKRHYLVSAALSTVSFNSQVRVTIAYGNRHTPRFPQNC